MARWSLDCPTPCTITSKLGVLCYGINGLCILCFLKFLYNLVVTSWLLCPTNPHFHDQKTYFWEYFMKTSVRLTVISLAFMVRHQIMRFLRNLKCKHKRWWGGRLVLWKWFRSAASIIYGEEKFQRCRFLCSSRHHKFTDWKLFPQHIFTYIISQLFFQNMCKHFTIFSLTLLVGG